MSFDKMQGGGSYIPSNNQVKSRFSYNTKNTQSIEAPEYLLGSREGIEQKSKFHLQGLKRDIGMRLGNSYEAPDTFKTEYGIISDKTYDNPHLKKSEQLQKYISQGPRKSNSLFSQVQKNSILGGNVKNIQTFNITDNFTEKTKQQQILQRQKTQPVTVIDNITHSQTKRNIPQIKINEKPEENYQKILQRQGSFKRTKDYFGDFIEKNDVMNVYAPLSQISRPQNHREVKVYNFTEEEQNRKKDIITATNKFVHNLSQNLRIQSEMSRSKSSQNSKYSLGKKITNIFSKSPENILDETTTPQLSNRSDKQLRKQYSIELNSYYKEENIRKKSNTTKSSFSCVYNKNKRYGNIDNVLENSQDTYYNTQINQPDRLDTMTQTTYSNSSIKNKNVDLDAKFSWYLKKKNTQSDYEKIPLRAQLKSQSQFYSPIKCEQLYEPPINSNHGKTYSSFFKKVGGLNKISKNSVMECLKKPANLEVDGNKYLSPNSNYKSLINNNIQKDMIAQSLSQKIFNKKYLYQNDKKQQIKDKYIDNEDKNMVKEIDLFEKKFNSKKNRRF